MSGNPNLTTGAMLPGNYGYVDYAIGSPAQAPNLRCMLWGLIGPTATATPNQPFRPVDGADAATKCGGTSSDLYREYGAALSQPQAQGADVWLMPITPNPAGVVATYTFKVFIPNTNPAKAGTIDLWICSQKIPSVGYTTTDTATTIGAAIAAAITSVCNGAGNVPLASAVNASGTVTLTYFHKGTTGEDLPVRYRNSPNGSGVNLAAGTALFATNSVGAGSVLLNVGAVTISTALAGAETPAQICAKVAASVNASTYPVTAVVDGATPEQLDIYFNDGWDVRRLSMAIVTSTGTTVNLGSGATSGVGSASSFTYNGTQGVGVPSLTQAISRLQTSQQWYRSQAAPWVDTTTLGALAAYIEAGSDGSMTGQKLQVLTVADFQTLSLDGAVPTGTAPNITATPPHYGFGWSPDCSVQAIELAARAAAARAAFWISTPQKNWNRFQFQGNAQFPILQPKNVPSLDTLNSALRTYALSPWIVGDSGNVEIVKGRTTSLASDLRLWAWSAEAQAAYHIQDLAAYYPRVFRAPDGSAASLVRYTDPKAPGIYDSQSFIDVTQARMRFWEKQGNYDGADLLAPQVTANTNAQNPNREEIDYPESPVLDLDQIVFTAHFTQPSQ